MNASSTLLEALPVPEAIPVKSALVWVLTLLALLVQKCNYGRFMTTSSTLLAVLVKSALVWVLCTRFACVTGTKVQILTHELSGTQFTCFTGTKVPDAEALSTCSTPRFLSLLALLVQKVQILTHELSASACAGEDERSYRHVQQGRLTRNASLITGTKVHILTQGTDIDMCNKVF